jgi:hypothetical protein
LADCRIVGALLKLPSRHHRPDAELTRPLSTGNGKRFSVGQPLVNDTRALAPPDLFLFPLNPRLETMP